MKEICKLSECFLHEIAAIEQSSFKDPWSINAYRDELNNPDAIYLVITENGSVIAYGGFWKILDEGHITNVAVKEEYRNMGVGSMLMQALIDEARGLNLRAMTLEVRVSNKPAIKLYEKFGFVAAGIRPKYYSDGEGALIMWREENSFDN